MIKKEIHTRRILNMPKIAFTDIVPITQKEKTKRNDFFLSFLFLSAMEIEIMKQNLVML